MTPEESLALNVAKVVQLASCDHEKPSRGFLKPLSECRDMLAWPIIDIVRRHDGDEIARLRKVLLDIQNPLARLFRDAQAEGAKLNGHAHSVANSVAFLQQIAAEALAGTDADRSVRLRAAGVSRHEEYPRSLVVTFTEAVTDDEMRDFHDFTRKWGRP